MLAQPMVKGGLRSPFMHLAAASAALSYAVPSSSAAAAAAQSSPFPKRFIGSSPSWPPAHPLRRIIEPAAPSGAGGARRTLAVPIFRRDSKLQRMVYGILLGGSLMGGSDGDL